MPTNRGLFEFTILGCSGGPISGTTCSFLIKPSNLDYDAIVNSEKSNCLLAVDAGTGLTSIVDLLKEGRDFLKTGNKNNVNYLLELYPNDFNSTEKFINKKNLKMTYPFSKAGLFENGLTDLQIGNKLINSLSGYLITHSHFDHISSLIINSPSFYKVKNVFGISQTIDSLKKNVFNNSVWPDLVSMNIISLNVLKEYQHYNLVDNDYYNVVVYAVSHGLINKEKNFLSSAFLVTDKLSQCSLLIFGDVEADCISKKKFNFKIWENISKLILEDKLNSIIIECSSVDKPPPLFGHMTPRTLFTEFLQLRKLCIDLLTNMDNGDYGNDFYKSYETQPISDLNVIIIHVKETFDSINPRTLILSRLNELNTEYNTGINFTMGLSGLSFLL